MSLTLREETPPNSRWGLRLRRAWHRSPPASGPQSNAGAWPLGRVGGWVASVLFLVWSPWVSPPSCQRAPARSHHAAGLVGALCPGHVGPEVQERRLGLGGVTASPWLCVSSRGGDGVDPEGSDLFPRSPHQTPLWLPPPGPLALWVSPSLSVGAEGHQVSDRTRVQQPLCWSSG